MAVPSISSADLAEWRREKLRLQKVIVDAQQRLGAVNQLINAAVILNGESEEVLPEKAGEADSIDPTNFMGTLAQLINSSPKPITRPELKEMAVAAGIDAEKVNSAYFHVALNRMKDAERISIRNDGTIWRGPRRI